jgi:HK97 family phage major capsid protein
MTKLSLKAPPRRRVVTPAAPMASASSYVSPEPAADDGIAELTHAIHEYNATVEEAVNSQSEAIEGLQRLADDLSRQLAAARIGGGTAAGGSSFQRGRDFQAFADWARGVRASMSTDSDPDGGYVVPDEVERQIGQLARDRSPMRQLCRTVTITGPAWVKHYWESGVGAAWVGEKDARPETANGKLLELRYPAMELYSNPATTQWLLDDATANMAEELARQIAEAFEDLEDAAFVNGSGVNQPRGFLSYPAVATGDATRPFGQFEYIPSGVANALTDGTHNGADVLVDTLYRLKSEYRQAATWQMSSGSAAVVRKLKDAEGRYIWQDGIAAGQPPTLLGRPVVLNENLPGIEANALPIWLADWQRAYVIVDRKGIQLLRDPYTSKPYVHFYATKRTGGGALDTRAAKAIKIATS